MEKRQWKDEFKYGVDYGTNRLSGWAMTMECGFKEIKEQSMDDKFKRIRIKIGATEFDQWALKSSRIWGVNG